MSPSAKGQYPNDLRYTREHEWARVRTDGTCVVGITTYAQDELGDIVFVELPARLRSKNPQLCVDCCFVDQYLKFNSE